VFELKNSDVLRNDAVSAVQAKQNSMKWEGGYGLLEYKNLKSGSSPCPNVRYCSLTFRHRNFLLNFSTPCIKNVNNTGTKKGSIMK